MPFPDCVGAMDGALLPISHPLHQTKYFITRKQYFMVLQSLVDSYGI